MLIASSIIGYLTLKSTVIHDNEMRLKQNIALLEHKIESVDNLDDFVQKISLITPLRITIVDTDGNVLAESETDKSTMENHANRIEIIRSATQEFGITTRYSSTLGIDFLYVAKRISYHNRVITLRLSVSLARIMDDFYLAWSRLAVVFLVFIILSLIISYNMSKKIQYDVTQISNYLDEIADKNYKAVIKTQYFNEFLQVSLKLKNLVKKLSSREKQKRKYTAKLRLVNKQRNDILSAISHEFKNPVASIRGYAETLYEDPNADPAIRKRFLGKIISNTDKISGMLDRLAISVKLENNDIKPHKERFDLCMLVQDSVSNISKKYRDRNIRLKCKKTSVYADKTMMEMVLSNLLDNALKYSDDDISITIAKERLSVTDKGTGIEPKELKKITSKFYRIRKHSWDNSMGLGLAIVSYILKLHHSTLDIKSSVGTGSTFGFDLKHILDDKSR
jgi:signal transduction histidine kinase